MATPTVHFPFKRTLLKPARRKLIRQSDGDTPVIEQPVRMVSADTPEKAGYAGKSDKSQPKLDECKKRLQSSFYKNLLPQALRDYLINRLSNDAAERHVEAGNRASEEFYKLMESRLTKEDGSRRPLAMIPTGEKIDTYGRLLAYFTPWFDKKKLPPKDDPRRRTFNLDMVENGWAVFFPIYPSLPLDEDMNMAITAAETAWNKKRGAWKEFGKDLLLAYEYRLCIKLAAAKTGKEGVKSAFERTCVDLRKMKVVGPFGFAEVPPPYRLWYWTKDETIALNDLGLSR